MRRSQPPSDAGPEASRPGPSGLTVAIVALPLALGFGVSSGLGAEAGLATAVVAGALAAVFGGSNLQVSGPTGAMTVVLVLLPHREEDVGAQRVGGPRIGRLHPGDVPLDGRVQGLGEHDVLLE
ncbi:SulP family inorganic anion transporter, partial [Streptomyces californicus]|uniref:SulP family inorganic anion transporter n=1 Tax=Streptomyces californicus TaxID=67351 RepID=UPI0036BAE338